MRIKAILKSIAQTEGFVGEPMCNRHLQTSSSTHPAHRSKWWPELIMESMSVIIY